MPTLADYIGVCPQQLEVTSKRVATVENEKFYLEQRSLKIGNIRLNKIRPHHLSHILKKLVARITLPQHQSLPHLHWRVLKAESDDIVAAVKNKGVPVEYIVFDDEGHGFTKKQTVYRLPSDLRVSRQAPEVAMKAVCLHGGSRPMR